MAVRCETRIRGMRLALVGVVLAGAGWSWSCASGRYVDDGNKAVRMPTHEFILPPNRLWFFWKDRKEQTTLVQHGDATTTYRFGW